MCSLNANLFIHGGGEAGKIYLRIPTVLWGTRLPSKYQSTDAPQLFTRLYVCQQLDNRGYKFSRVCFDVRLG